MWKYIVVNIFSSDIVNEWIFRALSRGFIIDHPNSESFLIIYVLSSKWMNESFTWLIDNHIILKLKYFIGNIFIYLFGMFQAFMIVRSWKTNLFQEVHKLNLTYERKCCELHNARSCAANRYYLQFYRKKCEATNSKG